MKKLSIKVLLSMHTLCIMTAWGSGTGPIATNKNLPSNSKQPIEKTTSTMMQDIEQQIEKVVSEIQQKLCGVFFKDVSEEKVYSQIVMAKRSLSEISTILKKETVDKHSKSETFASKDFIQYVYDRLIADFTEIKGVLLWLEGQYDPNKSTKKKQNCLEQLINLKVQVLAAKQSTQPETDNSALNPKKSAKTYINNVFKGLDKETLRVSVGEATNCISSLNNAVKAFAESHKDNQCMQFICNELLKKTLPELTTLLTQISASN